MNGHNYRMSVLLVGVLLVMLFITACATKNEINGSDGQALTDQGDAYMACMKAKDLQCATSLLSPGSKELVVRAEKIAGEFVDLDRAVKQYAPTITSWSFNLARFFTRDGKARGSLEGRVEYLGGKQGTVKLEFEKDDETWKVRSSELETGISPFNR